MNFLKNAGDKIEKVMTSPEGEMFLASASVLTGIPIPFNPMTYWRGVGDADLKRRIDRFVSEIHKMPLSIRQNLVKKANQDLVFGQKFGVYLISVLYKMDFEDKAEYLARLTSLYENGSIDVNQLSVLVTILNSVHLSELQYWVKIDAIPQLPSDQGFNHFLSLGLITQHFDLSRLEFPTKNPMNKTKLVQTRKSIYGEVIYSVVAKVEIDHFCLHQLKYEREERQNRLEALRQS